VRHSVGWEHKASGWHKAGPVENSFCVLPKDLGAFPRAGSRRSKSRYFYRTREQTEFSRNTAGFAISCCAHPLGKLPIGMFQTQINENTPFSAAWPYPNRYAESRNNLQSCGWRIVTGEAILPVIALRK